MALWDDGYITDVAYTTNAYQEAMPSWLAACSLLLGYRPPDLAAPFRYADMGCGNGLSTMVAAAANPHAECWGFDFNPTHIENARALARQAKLTNVRFEEVSFEALARGDAGHAGESFDFLVAHGVLSWISRENQRHLTAAMGRLLRAGGLVYLSYNATAGWSGMEPIRLLMRQLAAADQRRIDRATPDIFRTLDVLRTGGASFFRAHPGLEARLEHLKGQDPRYIAHEYLNRDWHPFMFAEVAEMMAETKAHYIGSATVIENLDAVSVPEGILPTFGTIHDVATRETVRDLASAKGFRRDMWRKGGESLPVQEHLAMLDLMMLAWTGKAVEAEIKFTGPIGTVTGQQEFYRPLLDAIQKAPVTLAELRALPEGQGRQMSEFVQATILMMGGGYAHPAWPHGARAEVRQSAAGLNRAIVGRLRLGVDIQRLAAPLIGSSIAMDVIEGFLIGRLLDGEPHEPHIAEGHPSEALIDAVLGDVTRSGRSLLRDGQPLRDLAEGRAMVGETLRGVLARRYQTLRNLGLIGWA
jgi:SAM-dependent methyltransferase